LRIHPWAKMKRFCFKNTFAMKSGTNPTITSYNASVVKIYNATNSIARF
jgi:hypothetical protein